MAVAGTSSSSIVPSLPPPRPKSPPDYPDLYGKRRELAKVLMLEREIGFLQEELKYVEGLQPASRCIKEVADFVAANSDPLIPTSRKVRRSCRLWKWLCGKSCFNMSWICCFGCPHLEMPSCCDCCNLQCCNLQCCNCSCCNCGIPKCRCIPCPSLRCLKKLLCCRSSCMCGCPRCPDCPSSKCKCKCKCTCSCLKCPKLPRCSCCTVNCCYPTCCLCSFLEEISGHKLMMGRVIPELAVPFTAVQTEIPLFISGNEFESTVSVWKRRMVAKDVVKEKFLMKTRQWSLPQSPFSALSWICAIRI